MYALLQILILLESVCSLSPSFFFSVLKITVKLWDCDENCMMQSYNMSPTVKDKENYVCFAETHLCDSIEFHACRFKKKKVLVFSCFLNHVEV